VRSNAKLAIGCAGMLLVTAAALAIGWRRRQTFALLATTAGVLGGIIGIVATTRATGGLFSYLVIWQAFVPCALLIGLGAAICGPAGRATASASGHAPLDVSLPQSWVLAGLLTAGAVVVAATTVNADRSVTLPWRQNVSVGVLATASEKILRPSDRWVDVTIGTAAVWPEAAGLVDQLEGANHRATVSPASWVVEFGHERLPGRPVSVRFDIYQQGDQAAASAFGGTVLAVSAGYVVSYMRSAPSS